MTPASSKESLRRLRDLFDQALALPALEREAFLQRQCGSDAKLRKQLDRMLAAEHADFLERPVAWKVAGVEPSGRLGRWTLRERVGEGATGVVYRAEANEDGIALEAAVKILRPGLDTGFLRQRFRQERSIVAGLDHPGIARFIDCGADLDGRSFLATEFVRGQSFGEFLQGGPSLAQRMRVFEELVRATAYLHGSLVAHGDIKPANIRFSAAGLPKLLDFGAARLLEDEFNAGSLTRMMLTPEYASPERRRGEGPSVSGDIYSLGRVLLDLLPANAPTDLRIVAAHCVAEEPAGRYASAAALAEDLERWREGFPVRARRATHWYRFTRFVRRQRAAVALTILLFGALAWAWAVAVAGERRAETLAREARSMATLAEANYDQARRSSEEARRQAGEAEAQRQRAGQAAKLATENAEHYRALVSQLLGGGDLSPDHGTVAVHPVLESALEQVAREYGSHSPAERAVAWRRYGVNLAFQGKFPQAIAALDRAAAFAKQAWRDEPTAPHHTGYVLVLLASVRVHMMRGMLRGNMDDVMRANRALLSEITQLPPPERARYEDTEAVRIARFLSRESEIPAEEAERLVSLAEERSYGFLHQLALRGLIAAYRRAGHRESAERMCRAVNERGFTGAGIAQLCQSGAGPQLTNPQLIRQRTLAGSYQHILNQQPAAYEGHVWLAEILLRLAAHHAATGSRDLARGQFERAKQHVAFVRAGDPAGPSTRRLSTAAAAVEARLSE